MKLPYTFLIAFRYLKSRKRYKSISINTIISLMGVIVGVMALIIVMSVMGGFHNDLYKKILGVNAHIVVSSYSGNIHLYKELTNNLNKFPGVVSTAPFVMGQVMAAHRNNAQGVIIRGIIPKLEKTTTDFDKYIKKGSLISLEGTKNSIIIGQELAAALGVTIGSDIDIVAPMGDIGPFGMIPKTRKFKVAAIFEVGMYEYDSNLAITSIEAAQDFFDLPDSANGIEIKITDAFNVKTISKQIRDSLGYPFSVRDWMDMNKNLFSALKLEKLAMFIILILVVIVASFNIVSTLIMNVIEKEREIAILKTMGATNQGIMMIFMLQGFLIGLIGTLIGLAGGTIVCYVLDTWQLIKLPGDVYYLTHLPVKMEPLDTMIVTISAILISFVSTIYPAWQASKLNPVEALRFE
ncbi:MAG: lipoprotein-releasing ABC transporter permease subunit [Nitrospirae bacterium]|nr:lipoprotein-releasing ABC transporter permease subunit [Nitrospirota bacterium]MBF0540035.1 lipoprotein-releasing ABC transporter permease subunit [Nitrospirota bacterium]